VQILDGRRLAEQVKQERRRDVVGQVADDPQAAAAACGQGGEIKGEGVRRVQFAACAVHELATQPRGQVAVDLYGVEAAVRAAQQFVGEGATSRADFHQAVAGANAKRRHDSPDHGRVVQEVLPEALADVRHQRPRAASPIASCTAAARLPTSALPVPARSSAVP
jgi:hypothetical protein